MIFLALHVPGKAFQYYLFFHFSRVQGWLACSPESSLLFYLSIAVTVFKYLSQSPQSSKDNYSITAQQHQPSPWALVGASHLRIYRLVYVQFAETWSSFTKGTFSLSQMFSLVSGAWVSWRTVFIRRMRQRRNWVFQPFLPCPIQQQVHIFTAGLFVTFVLTDSVSLPLGFAFPNSMSACPNSVFVFLSGCLSLLPPPVCFVSVSQF